MNIFDIVQTIKCYFQKCDHEWHFAGGQYDEDWPYISYYRCLKCPATKTVEAEES